MCFHPPSPYLDEQFFDIQGDLYSRWFLRNTHIVAPSRGKRGNID